MVTSLEQHEFLSWRLDLLGVDRKSWARAENDANDPLRTFRTTDKIVF
jgi:hypothetical protein